MPYKDEDKQRAWQKKRRKAARDFVRSVKMESGCVLCGYAVHPDALAFHHQDEDEKEWSINNMVARNCSKRRIRKEMNKCVVLCNNCHAVIRAIL